MEKKSNMKSKSKKYSEMYKKSVENREAFWDEQGKCLLSWDTEYSSVFNGLSDGSSKWYEGGKLNACYNAVDRHASSTPNKAAIIFDSNEGIAKEYTFNEVKEEVVKIARVLRNKGVKKGDCVAIYMTMSPWAVFSVLACARLGVVHNVIFGGFSAESVLLRLEDSKAVLLITEEEAKRGESVIEFWKVVEEVSKKKEIPILLFPSFSKTKKIKNGKNFLHWEEVSSQLTSNSEDQIPCVPVDSEDPLFYLYTSGSTGMPKGIVHSTGGYLVYAALTSKICFDLRQGDVFCCTADIGWITGHTYSLYGPLLNGVTTVIFGGTPFFPSNERLFEMVEKLKITQLYTAPTVIRTLMKSGVKNSSDCSSLRLLGSVGEPINREAYKWFTESFNNLPIVDTYWQTESGGVMVAPIPYVIEGQPECASLPFLGVECVVAVPGVDPVEEAPPYQLGHVLFKGSWPGMARGILNNPERFKKAYFPYSGFYFTGDEGYKDKENLIWIRGRADDVINVSGHRLSTAEMESAACTDPNIAEAAVVGIEDEITGQALCFFVVLKDEKEEKEKVKKSLKETLRKKIGKLVHPKEIYICKGIPKTATGKIMRRILRDVLMGNSPGDLSTCVNGEVIESILKMAGKIL